MSQIDLNLFINGLIYTLNKTNMLIIFTNSKGEDYRVDLSSMKVITTDGNELSIIENVDDQKLLIMGRKSIDIHPRSDSSVEIFRHE